MNQLQRNGENIGNSFDKDHERHRNIIIEFVITEMAMLIQATQGLKNQQQLSFKDLIVLSYYHII